LGAVVSAPVIAGIYLAYGWRITFLSIAILGFVWIVPWLIINKTTPDKHPRLSDEERNHILEKEPAQLRQSAKVYNWLELLSFRNTWSLLLARFFY
jgi:ACS family hexuronate transporter-like MFS transporter